MDGGSAALKNLIRSRRPGHSLPADLYARQDVFEADMAVFFGRHWIYVGLEIDVPEPGDTSTLDIGAASIILLRDEEGEVRALRNVCRHRGARLTDCGKSTVGKLVCPYHQWTYELTGELAFARHMGTDFDKAGHGLLPVPLRSVEGLLFACLGDAPPEDFATLEQVMTPRLAPFDLRNTKIAFEHDIVEEGNWKLAVENNRECYHCAGSHPELNNSFIAQDFGFNPAELSAEERVESQAHDADCEAKTVAWEAAGYVSRAADYLSGCVSAFRTQRLVIHGAGESQTLDTRVASRRLLGTLSDKALGDVHFWTHNSWHHFMSDHVVTICMIPLAPTRTLIRTKWLVHRDAVEGVDYDVDNLTKVWLATNAQDQELVGRAQRGVLDPGYRPGPYSAHTERYLDRFADWYLDRLQAHGF
jgi:Rieske 2Fe-2S family protein